MRTPERGEVWLADLGAAAKTRPVLVLNVPFADSDYALFQIVSHTTQRRGSQFEVAVSVGFLEPGVFNLQGLQAISVRPFVKYLGTLAPNQMRDIENGVRKWLGLVAPK